MAKRDIVHFIEIMCSPYFEILYFINLLYYQSA